VVGDVVGLAKVLDWYGHKPLSGKRVLVTGSLSMVERLSPILKEEGAEAISFSLIRTENLHNPSLKTALDEIGSYSWIIFTSANGVTCFFDELKILRKDIRDFAHIHFAVIGEGTKKALEDRGIYSDFIPLAYSSEDMAKAILPLLGEDDRVLMLRAQEANEVLPRTFSEAGVAYTNISLYHTVRDYRKADELNRLIGMVDYITFASSSAVKAYVDMVEDLKKVKAKYISIGPVTTKTAEKLGLKIHKTAASYTARGIVDMILKDVEEGKKGKVR
jgi:uroporphyrinogen III methyltransferase/synthase